MQVHLKPRLLFLAFSFPPMHAVSAVRAGNIAKYLSRTGWDVAVVTPNPTLLQRADDSDRVAAEFDKWGVQRIYTGHRWGCLSAGYLRGLSYRRDVKWLLEGISRRIARAMGIDGMIGWYREAERACARLGPGDVDIVMATGGPFGAFGVAQRLGRRLRCPHVLDYRDLWNGNPHSNYATQGRCEEIEQKLLQDCTAISVVSESMAKWLGDRFGVSEKVHVIPNGYAPDDFEGIAPARYDHFSMVYTGIFYPPKRSVDPLMQALRRLREIVPTGPWRFHYYGPNEDHVRKSAQTYGVERQVEMYGVVPRRECLSAIRGAGVAVVVTSVYDVGDLADRGILTGKIFEPIGLGTPILVIAPPGSDVETVVQTVGKGAVFTGTDVEGMANFLAALMQGKTLERKHPEAYAWPNLILKMDSLLRGAMMASQGAGSALYNA
jgi:glycosyltransferase involved in cell wall biosynthesis